MLGGVQRHDAGEGSTGRVGSRARHDCLIPLPVEPRPCTHSGLGPKHTFWPPLPAPLSRRHFVPVVSSCPIPATSANRRSLSSSIILTMPAPFGALRCAAVATRGFIRQSPPPYLPPPGCRVRPKGRDSGRGLFLDAKGA
jgi:hypothetical protein